MAHFSTCLLQSIWELHYYSSASSLVECFTTTFSKRSREANNSSHTDNCQGSLRYSCHCHCSHDWTLVVKMKAETHQTEVLPRSNSFRFNQKWSKIIHNFTHTARQKLILLKGIISNKCLKVYSVLLYVSGEDSLTVEYFRNCWPKGIFPPSVGFTEWSKKERISCEQ